MFTTVARVSRASVPLGTHVNESGEARHDFPKESSFSKKGERMPPQENTNTAHSLFLSLSLSVSPPHTHTHLLTHIPLRILIPEVRKFKHC